MSCGCARELNQGKAQPQSNRAPATATAQSPPSAVFAKSEPATDAGYRRNRSRLESTPGTLVTLVTGAKRTKRAAKRRHSPPISPRKRLNPTATTRSPSTPNSQRNKIQENNRHQK